MRLDDSIIHATIVRQDEPTDDLSSIYTIFERLNTGGVNLKPQEIRMALYHGPFAQLLLKFNAEKVWRTLYGDRDKRLKDIELLLRFFSFHYHFDEYETPMKAFLNDQMEKNRELQQHPEAELADLFQKTTLALKHHLGQAVFTPKGRVNAALAESVMRGVAKRLERGAIADGNQLKQRYSELLANPDFDAAISKHTSSKANVKLRLELAAKAFADVG